MTEGEKNALGFLAAKLNASDAPTVRKACVVLRDSRPAETLAPLCVCYWHAPAEIRQLVAPTLLDLATALPTPLWPKIDEAIRDGWCRWGPGVDEDFPTDAGTVLVAMCHPSGRIRGRAATMTAVLPPLLAASLLLVRINDWADEIREYAASGLELALDHLSSADKMAVAPLVARLRTCGRFAASYWRFDKKARESAMIERWFDHLAASFNPEAWRGLWIFSRGAERRVYFELLQRSNIKPSPGIRQDLLGSNDRAALLWYIRDLLPQLGENERSEAAEAIARSRAVPVQRFWLLQQMESDPAAAIEELVGTLTNRSRSLREFARYHLSKLAPMDFRAHYRARLDDPLLEPWALRGLAEVPDATVQGEALARLESPLPMVRQAAIEILEPDSLGDHLDYLLRTTATGHPAPAAAARKRLKETTSILGPHLLGALDQVAALPPDTRSHLIRLAPLFTKWHGLEFLLRMTADELFSEDASKALQIWRTRERRSFVRLDPTRRATLLQLTAKAKVAEGQREFLRFTIERAE